MSVSENIRKLGREGLNTADIASRLSIRYQHAYNVLKASGMQSAPRSRSSVVPNLPSRSAGTLKPALLAKELIAGGFELSGRWMLSEAGHLRVDRPLPDAVGIYAFAKGEIVVYVGVATMGLARRLYSYGKPGKTQSTNLRINDLLRSELLTVPSIEIYSHACRF